MVQGRGVDASLNDTGRSQAKKVFDALKGSSIDMIYTSKLIRTHETVQLFDVPKKAMEGFDEISWGSQEGVVPSVETRDLYWSVIQLWRKGQLDECVGGGESPNEVMKRQKIAMKEVMANGLDTSLISMHGRAMRILLCWLMNYPLQYMDGFEHQNCCYYKLRNKDGMFTIDEFCYVEHLK